MAVDISGWKKSAFHEIVLPSGVTVGIKIPDLAMLCETGEMPNDLIDAALGYVGRQKQKAPTMDDVALQRRFTDKLVEFTVVEPKLSPEDVKEIPVEDKDMIVEIATRTRDLDAEGSHIGGLDKSEKFRTFRGLDPLD